MLQEGRYDEALTRGCKHLQERLRALAADRLVHSVLREWRDEGIFSGSIDIPDGSGIIELLSRPASGIFALVDAATAGVDAPASAAVEDAGAALLGKMQRLAAVTPSGARSTAFALAGPTSAYRRSDLDFVVRHTFGSVVYTASGFDGANRAGVSAALADVLRNESTDALVALLFSGEQTRDVAAVALAPTVAQRWAADLDAICGRLTTSPGLHVVQCIKVWMARMCESSLPQLDRLYPFSLRSLQWYCGPTPSTVHLFSHNSRRREFLVCSLFMASAGRAVCHTPTLSSASVCGFLGGGLSKQVPAREIVHSRSRCDLMLLPALHDSDSTLAGGL